MEAIKQTKVNISVYLGNYNVPTDQGAAYVRQRDTIKEAIQTYGTDNILGVTVGNEFMLKYVSFFTTLPVFLLNCACSYLDANGGGDAPNGPVGAAGAAALIPNITDTKSMLTSLNVNLPVGTADAGSFFNNEVLENVAYGVCTHSSIDPLKDLTPRADVQRPSVVRQCVNRPGRRLDVGVLPGAERAGRAGLVQQAPDVHRRNRLAIELQ